MSHCQFHVILMVVLSSEKKSLSLGAEQTFTASLLSSSLLLHLIQIREKLNSESRTVGKGRRGSRESLHHFRRN